MSGKLLPAISYFFQNTVTAVGNLSGASLFTLIGIAVAFILLIVLFVFLAKKKIIRLPWAVASLVLFAGILFYFTLSASSGTLVFLYSENPEETASSFLNAVVADNEALAESMLSTPTQIGATLASPGPAENKLEQALKNSYSYELTGNSVLDGTSATQSAELTSLNLEALVPDLLEEVNAQLAQKIENGKKSDVYDSDENYRPEVLEDAYLSSLEKVLGNTTPYLRTTPVNIGMNYRDGNWKVLPNDDLKLALNGFSTSGNNYANNIKSEVLGELTYIPKIYTLPEDATAGPAPSPESYGETSDPQEIVELIKQYPRLVGDKEPFFDPNADFIGNTIEYYADETILCVVWKERYLGHGCNFAEVYLADPSQFRRKLSMDTFGSPVQKYGSELAREANAVVAMNGDFYKFRAEGMTVYNRTLYRFNPVKLELCHVNSKGELNFTYAGELADKDAAEKYIKENDILFTLAFGPVLIADGQPHISSDSYLIGEVTQRYSRSILATRGACHYLLTTCNNGYGTPTATIAEARDMMIGKGVENAYILDGGQTAEIIIRDHVSNHIDFNTERTVSDILYFATALPEDERN